MLQTGWKAYLDGSLRDGPNELLTRAGFGFIVYDQHGTVKAAACGVPPPWVNSIHGAELWALYAALRISLPGVTYRSDRKAVVDTFKAGERTATAATVEMARLWRLVFAACDSTPEPHLNVDLAWMPAHTKQGDVGTVRLSDGSLLSKRDRQANDAADFLAKRGAQTHRVPRKLRQAFKEREMLAEWGARALGLATFAANNLKVDGEKGTRRDSTGLPKARRQKRGGDTTVVAAEATADPPAHSEANKTPGAAEGATSDATATGAATTTAAAAPPGAGKGAKAVGLRSEQDASSSCDSSEVDLELRAHSSSARACRTRQLKTARERTHELALAAARRASTDENEATAPQRLKNVRKRVQWRESVATAPASNRSRTSPLEAADERQATAPALELDSCGPTPLGERSVEGPPRPTRAPRTSLAAEQRAAAAAISSLLS